MGCGFFMALLQPHERVRKPEREVQLQDLELLLVFAERLSSSRDLQFIVEETLRAAAEIGGADMGMLSLYREDLGALQLQASLGFTADQVAQMTTVPVSSGACGTCYLRAERIIVEDTEADPLFETYREFARAAGFRMVHSTPLIGRDGERIGVLSTHYQKSQRPTEREIRLTDLCARHAVDAIENARLFRQSKQEIEVRKRAETELSKKERLLSLVYEHTSDGLYLANVEPNGVCRFLTINDSFLRLSGYTRDQVVGRSMEEIVPRENHELVRSKYLEAIATRKPVTYSETANLPAGTRHAEITLNPVFAGAGPVTHIMGTIRDVTLQRQAEIALRESEARMRRLADNLPSGFIYQVVHSVDGLRTFNYLSAGVEAVCGLTPNEALADAQAMYAMIEPEDLPRLMAKEEAAFLRGGPFECQFRLRSRSGEIRWVHARSRPRSAQGGDVTWDGVAIDLTERKFAEDRLEAVLASIDDHLVCYDHEWRYTYVNDKAAAVLRKSREELLGHSIWDVFPDAVGNEYFQKLHEAVAEQKPICFEHYYEPYDTWFENHIYPNSHGVTVYSAVVNWRKRMEQELLNRSQELADADRKKDQFIALLAHELRNPLAPLRNGLQVLRLTNADSPAALQAREMMERQLGHLVRLIDDLLDVSRISQNKLNLKRARVQLAEIVRNAVETARPSIDSAGHELTIAIPEAAVTLDADLTRLSQVVSNLLTNSAKYTDPGGKIWLSAHCDGEFAILSVRDTGIGIPAECLPRIFDMFSQVDRSIERTAGGLGIGLALVKGLVEMHGGTVTAHSNGLGKGSEFVVRLPLASVNLGVASATHGGPIRTGQPKLRILVVDDNRDAAESMAMMLRLMGDEVSTAHDGAEGFDQADKLRPDVILMDVGMPRLNGFEATRQIRQMAWGRKMTIVALTGWGQEADRQQSRAAGCDGHLVKPVNLDDLERLLADLNVGVSN